jgi:outer membrane protein assembly factor BamB
MESDSPQPSAVGVIRFAVLVLIGTALVSSAADWPGFRGPNRDGIAPDKGINKNWTQRPPPLLWKQSLSDDGYAGPAVSGRTLYIVDHSGSNDIVRALDVANGKELWRYSYSDAAVNRQGFTVSTPMIWEGKVFIFSRLGKVICLRASSGELIWKRDPVAEYKGGNPPWKFTMSPVIDDGKLIFCPGGTNAAVVALDPNSGKTIWVGGGSANASYATPVVAMLNGRKHYVVFMVPGLYGVDSSDGRLLWKVPWKTNYGGKKGPTPVLVGDRIFICSTEGGSGGLIDFAGGAPRVVWQHKLMQEHFPTPIYYHSRIYGSSDPKFLICLDPETGGVHWKETAGAYASVIGVDDVVIFLSGSTGELIMVDATSPVYKELGRCKPLGGQSWTAPIIADGRLYVRNKKELACLDLSP